MPKRIFLIVNKHGSKGARKVANRLKEVTRTKVFLTTNPHKRRKNAFQYTLSHKGIPKLEQYQKLTPLCPDFTTDKATAFSWLQKGRIVFARTLLNSSSGKGILVLRPNTISSAEEIPYAPVYCRYIRKVAEYRVHVIGEEFLFQRKLRKRGVTREEPLIRNHSNHYVYSTINPEADDTTPSLLDELKIVASTALNKLSITSGAIDIIRDNNNKLYVLEVNRACGKESSATVEAYTKHIHTQYLQIHSPSFTE